MIIEHNFENPVVLGQTPVLLDFYAEWCGPCKVMSEMLDKFSKEYPDFKIYKVNVDEQEDLASSYDITTCPAIIYINKEGVIWQHYGLMPYEQLKEILLNGTK